MFAWEDVKAMFNGGSRKRVVSGGPSTSSNNNAPKSSSADPVQPSGSGSPPVKKAKKTVSKVSSSSASIRLSNSVEVAPQSPALSTASSIQQPITSNNLLARLSSIASNPAATALLEGKSPLLPADYWNHRNLCWPSGTAAPYPAAAAALAPFHPYSYYNYLISKSDQLMQQMAHPAGWQRSLPLIPPVILQQNEEEDDADEIDVESTIWIILIDIIIESISWCHKHLVRTPFLSYLQHLNVDWHSPKSYMIIGVIINRWCYPVLQYKPRRFNPSKKANRSFLLGKWPFPPLSLSTY